MNNDYIAEVRIVLCEVLTDYHFTELAIVSGLELRPFLAYHNKQFVSSFLHLHISLCICYNRHSTAHCTNVKADLDPSSYDSPPSQNTRISSTGQTPNCRKIKAAAAPHHQVWRRPAIKNRKNNSDGARVARMGGLKNIGAGSKQTEEQEIEWERRMLGRSMIVRLNIAVNDSL